MNPKVDIKTPIFKISKVQDPASMSIRVQMIISMIGGMKADEANLIEESCMSKLFDFALCIAPVAATYVLD